MTTGSISLIVALAALILMSSFFSASETAYSALNRIRLKSLAASGNKKAAKALALSANYDELLSTVLIGNNIVNILSSSLATVLFVGWFGNLGVTLATVVTTVLVLIFGEISPKTLAKEAPESFAMISASILKILVIIFTPVNYLLSGWKRLILRVFRIKPNHSISEQELLTYVEEVRAEGGINEQDEENIRKAIAFDDLQANDIYTHRVDVTAAPLDAPVEEIQALFDESGFTRLPVYRENMDDIAGIIIDTDFYNQVEEEHQPLASIVRPVLFVTKTAQIAKLLDLMQQKKIHMAVVVDEYGGTMGILTLEDIVEEMMGDIWDEDEDEQEEITLQPDGTYKILGSTRIKSVFELFGLKPKVSSASLGGWVFEVLGRFPQPGESFQYENLRVTVDKMDGYRVKQATIQQVEPLPTSEG